MIAPIKKLWEGFRADKSYPVCSYHLGFDIGSRADHCALVLCRHEWAAKRVDPLNGGAWVEVPYSRDKTLLSVVDIERIPLHTNLVDVVGLCVEKLRAIEAQTATMGSVHDDHRSRVRLCIDATGLGTAVTDLFYRAGIPHLPVYITASGNPHYDPLTGGMLIPKRDLIIYLRVLLGQKRLKISGSLRDADLLKQELTGFRRTLTRTGHDRYEAGGGQQEHDDLVMATALGCWSTKGEWDNRQGELLADAFRQAIYYDD